MNQQLLNQTNGSIVPAISGSSSSTTTPGPSTGSQVLGGVVAAGSIAAMAF